MAELGIIASIIGVAGAGFRLSLILNAVGCQIANAPSEIHEISKSVSLFSLLLKQTAAVLEHTNSVHSEEALQTTEQVLQESNVVFREINTMLERMRSRREDGSISPSMRQRFKWCFKKHGVLYLLGRIDRLQMSLSLMLQILQLGASMASTSRNDPPQRVKEMSDKIKRERVEAQNFVVLYYSESKQVEHLYEATKQEELEPRSPIDIRREDSASLTLVSTEDSQLAKIESLHIVTDDDLTVKAPAGALCEIDEEQWKKLDQSPEEMITVSDQIINKLLHKWTIWRQRRDQGTRYSGSSKDSRYRTNVQDSHDEEDGIPLADRYQERGENVRGRLLEGTTTDWRNPHSTEARHKAARLKKAYAVYQPSVSAASSEAEDSPESTGSKHRAPKRYVLDSGDESSEPEPEPEKVSGSQKPTTGTRRGSSGVHSSEQAEKEVAGTPMTRTLSSPSTNITADQRAPQPAYKPPVPNVSSSHQRRPYAAPDQNLQHHSFSTPGPAQSNLGRPFQYLPPPSKGPPPPNTYLPPYPNQQSPYMPQSQATTPPSTRYVPRLSPQSTYMGSQRPVSREGKPPKSPSRLSYSSHAYSSGRPKETEEEKRARKKQLRRDMGDTAARGLLAGGGLVALLEALEALDI